MGTHDRDWYHEGRAERDAMPHPTARKRPVPMKVAPVTHQVNETVTRPGQKDLMSGGFKSGFVWGVMFTSCISLLIYLYIR